MTLFSLRDFWEVSIHQGQYNQLYQFWQVFRVRIRKKRKLSYQKGATVTQIKDCTIESIGIL